MKIVHADEIATIKASAHRVGASMRQRLLDGPPGALDGYSLVIARPKDRYSPRHRHNFEQFRYQIEGVADYSRTGKLHPGMIGYFPESVHYGPQLQGEGQSLCLLTLQFGGAGGGGYAGRTAVMEATEELMKLGTFKDGVFHRNPGTPGKKNVDGFQAIWEHINKRPLVYAKPRYEAPVLMHPDHYDWVPVEASPGAYEKVMGVFTERRAQCGFVRLDAGASWQGGGGRDIYFVVEGTGTVEGQGYRKFTTVELKKGETARFEAGEPTEILNLRLPNLEGLRVETRPELEAAE